MKRHAVIAVLAAALIAVVVVAIAGPWQGSRGPLPHAARSGLVVRDFSAKAKINPTTGQTLNLGPATGCVGTCSNYGVWSGCGTAIAGGGYTGCSFTFQWQRCNSTGQGCVNISGATGASYTTVAGDVGATVDCVVTATANGVSASQTTLATGVITATTGLSISVNSSTGQFVNQNGTAIRLLGVDATGTEDQCPTKASFIPLNSTTANAIANWAGAGHINVVRIPLAEDCWLGTASGTYSGTTYQNAIISWVTALNNAGLYAILDMHDRTSGNFSYPAPDSSAGAFWISVATTFANNHAVIFDLLNEPGLGSYSSVSQANWDCWLNGCAAGASGNNAGFATTGMQTLVNDIRAHSNQPIQLTGNSYAGGPCLGPDSNCAVFENWPSDPQQQLALDVHQYGFDGTTGGNTFCPNNNGATAGNSGGCWNKFWSAANDTSTYPNKPYKVPISIGELGPNPNTAVDNGFYENFMTWADAQSPRVGYLGWSIQAGSSKALDLTTNTAYTTPLGCNGSVSGGNGGMGCYIQAHLSGTTTAG